MTGATTTGPNLRANGEQHAEHLSARVLTREAVKVCTDLGLTIRGNRLHLLVSRYLATGRADVDFRTWFIAYADPTGETACRNVMRLTTHREGLMRAP